MNVRTLLKNFSIVCFGLLFGLTALAAPSPGGGGTPQATYSPDAKVVQGNQPLVQSYPLKITSPSNLPSGTATTITLGVSILSKSNTVPDATVLSFVSLTPASLTFTGPNQTLETTVTVNVPVGAFAGSYAYRLKPTGWPTNITFVDEGATVNALVSPQGGQDSGPPAVTLQTPANGTVYTYYPVTGIPVSVPITFDASVSTGGAPISTLKAYVDGTEVLVTSTGLGTMAASGASTLSLTTPGLYNVRVVATNTSGSSEDEGDFNVVVSAPPPSITVATPLPNATFNFPAGSSGVSVPVSYTATSLYGNITATGATLNGQPITLSLSGVGTSLVATGSVSLQISTPGSHVLQFTATNDYGAATPVVVPFTVTTNDPVPNVSILSPGEGAVFTRTTGDAPTAVNFTFSGGTTFGTVSSVTVAIDGQPVSATVNGLGSASITGSGSVSYSAAGTHNIVVTLSNGYATATDQSSFTVQENAANADLKLTWLPPITYHKTIDGGTVMPVKFTLENQGVFVRDESVLISIYEVFPDGTMGTPVLYPYGGINPNEPDYAINGTEYQLDFTTAAGVHKYRVEVYKPLGSSGNNLKLLGTEHILTKTKSNCGKSDKSSKSDKSCKSNKSDKSDKSSKCDKSGKSNKSDKSTKSDHYGKSDKSGKDYGSGNCGKSGKDSNYGKSDKSGKSGSGYGKSDKSGKSGYGKGNSGGGSNGSGNCNTSSKYGSQNNTGSSSSSKYGSSNSKSSSSSKKKR